MKINGDDIVFRAPRAQYEDWARFVGSVGLRLSRGKTLVDEKYFSLNSAFFWSRRDRPPRPVPVTRVACFTKPFEDWGALAGSYRSFTRGFSADAKVAAEVIFLRHFRGRILQAGRSVRRGLGVPASRVALQRSGLWRRECWYAHSVPAESDVLPISPSRLKWGSVPPGWKRVPASSVRLQGQVHFHPEGEKPRRGLSNSRTEAVEEIQKCFWRELVARTWQEAPTRGVLLADYRESVIRTSREGLYRSWRQGGTFRRTPAGTRFYPWKPFIRQWQCKTRIPSNAADGLLRPREPLVWAPVVDDAPMEVGDPVDVASLTSWWGTSFSPPSSYDVMDWRYGLGYR